MSILPVVLRQFQCAFVLIGNAETPGYVSRRSNSSIKRCASLKVFGRRRKMRRPRYVLCFCGREGFFVFFNALMLSNRNGERERVMHIHLISTLAINHSLQICFMSPLLGRRCVRHPAHRQLLTSHSLLSTCVPQGCV